MGGTRTGGYLTAAERAEYTALLEGIEPEEQEWVAAQRGPAMCRPAEPHATMVVAAGKGRRGEQEYGVQWDNGEEGWGPRPHTGEWGPGVRTGMAATREAWEADGGARGLRERLGVERGGAWLWLATQAPQAVGRRSTPEGKHTAGRRFGPASRQRVTTPLGI